MIKNGGFLRWFARWFPGSGSRNRFPTGSTGSLIMKNPSSERFPEWFPVSGSQTPVPSPLLWEGTGGTTGPADPWSGGSA